MIYNPISNFKQSLAALLICGAIAGGMQYCKARTHDQPRAQITAQQEVVEPKVNLDKVTDYDKAQGKTVYFDTTEIKHIRPGELNIRDIKFLVKTDDAAKGYLLCEVTAMTKDFLETRRLLETTSEAKPLRIEGRYDNGVVEVKSISDGTTTIDDYLMR